MMTKQQLNNLQKLHDFVKSHVPPKYFDMSYYRANEKQGYLSGDVEGINQHTMKTHTCGTVGCLLGWTPFSHKSTLVRAKLLPKGKDQTISFDAVSETLFGIEGSGSDDLRWNYLFDSDWAKHGDAERKEQKKQALKRIRKLIKTNGVFTDEMKKEMLYNNVSYPGDCNDY